MTAHNGMTTPHIVFDASHVHGAAFALRHPRCLPKQFSHDFIDWNSRIDRYSMVAICSDDTVARLSRRDQTGRNRLLPDIQVHEPTDLPRLIQLRAAFFYAADQHHLVIQIK